MWSDSKTVLAWINSDHRNYRQFVACRIGEILSKSDVEQWRWVPTKENPADLATKWGRGPCLSPNSQWFRGPNFLRTPESEWPAGLKPTEQKTTEELRACMVHTDATVSLVVDWARFSNWTRLVRAVAYVLRFCRNVLRRVKKDQLGMGLLTQQELAQAEINIFRMVQREQYPDEVAVLSKELQENSMKGGRLERTSKIRTLSPYMDDAGVIRSESRISAATFVAYDTRFPIILPKEHEVTRLLLQWYHRRFLHANGETIVHEVRQRFHISALRAAVRNIAKLCQMCKVKKATPAVPRMAPFPEARLKPYERSFSYVGLDYFGPISFRVNRSTVKRWIALFTCLTTRAVHLEVAHSLSTESCKQAIRRFIGRRGAPVEIRSDRGTNFVGANNDLRKEMIEMDRQLAETFTNTNTRWVFNPPAAPHMGGAWERLVRYVKTAMAAIQTTEIPKEEALATFIVEAESVVNSRPLTFIPLETEQQEALTPNHFLLLSSTGVKQPPKILVEPKMVCRGSWELCRSMVDQFWRRWIREYLPTIARRTKWFGEVRPIAVGDLVVIVEEKVRNGWIRGRVVKVNEGTDGRVREAEIQTATGMMKRPVAKIARLDIEESKAGQ
ncbi:uncharacterized protein LOC134290665 [Aedes albopictus]|uniref:Integrase catalytic domain-containing protein n=1 Tax=Aedes albopictus TaxID=7160 RepID=A0ABM1ZXW4_AEDAL